MNVSKSRGKGAWGAGSSRDGVCSYQRMLATKIPSKNAVLLQPLVDKSIERNTCSHGNGRGIRQVATKKLRLSLLVVVCEFGDLRFPPCNNKIYCKREHHMI